MFWLAWQLLGVLVVVGGCRGDSIAGLGRSEIRTLTQRARIYAGFRATASCGYRGSTHRALVTVLEALGRAENGR